MRPTSTVSCKPVQSIFQHLISRGLSERELRRRLATDDPFLQTEYILNRRNRLPWDSFVHFIATFANFFESKEEQLAFATQSISSETSWLPYVQTFGRLVSSPLQLYWLNNRFLGPSVFGDAIESSLDVLDDGRLRIELRIAEGYVDCPLFFQLSHFGLLTVPKLIGLQDSSVESELSARRGVYLVTPPPSHSLGARITRAFRSFFFAGSALRELSQQDRVLRSHYDRLLASESALRTASSQLEERVAARTQELEATNRRLQEKIEQITHKDHENQQLNERVSHLQKLEAIGTLAGGISHEVNNILHGIFLSIDLADRKIAADHEAKEKIQTAREFAIRGQELVRQVLTFSRKARFNPRPIAMVAALKEATRLVRFTLQRHISLVEKYPTNQDESPWILGDQTQLQQLIINLCTNAAYAMRREGGSVVIEVTRDPATSQACLCVSDTGEGISAEHLPHVFEPFFTTKPEGQGTGMGLAVVKDIVDSLKGSVTVTSSNSRTNSASNPTTQFKILLPIVEPPGATNENEPQLDVLGGSERVLVVDDEPELLALLDDTLSAFGYTVTVARDGHEALSLFASAHFDLVLTDHLMPGMNGLELARKLRELRATIPILLCTGFSETTFSIANSVAISSCVTKPLDALTLNEAIRELLRAEPRL